MTSGCALGEVAEMVHRDPVPVAVEAARTAPAVRDFREGRENRKCDLCTKLGLGGENHSREWCYVDPKSRAYKPEVRQRRVAQAKARGIPVPPELLVEDAGKSQNLVQELGQLLATMGGSGPAQDTLLDQLLEYS